MGSIQTPTSQWPRENWQWSQQEAQWSSRSAESCSCGAIWCWSCWFGGWEHSGWGGAQGGSARLGATSRGDTLCPGCGSSSMATEPGMSSSPATPGIASSWARTHLGRLPRARRMWGTGEKHVKNYQSCVTSKERLRLAEFGEEDAKGQANSSLKLFWRKWQDNGNKHQWCQMVKGVNSYKLQLVGLLGIRRNFLSLKVLQHWNK